MIDPHHPSYPLPPMDETESAGHLSVTAGPAKKTPAVSDATAGVDHIGDLTDMVGVVGAPPHSMTWPAWIDGSGKEVRQFSVQDALDRQTAYAAHRRAHAEAIGRPYPAERHAVWPR